jgi:hypothetical protein
MAHKRIERTIKASVFDISRRGTDGITIKISHAHQGSKHYTHHVDNFQLSFCDMKLMGFRFHKIMDELSKEWHSTKEAISGESQ